MSSDRSLKRRHLIYYLEVYDDETGKMLGHLVDITTEGLKLVSREPFPRDKKYKMRMKLPEGYFEERELHFEAISRWGTNAVNPDFYDTGFTLTNMDNAANKVVFGLITLIGFNDA